MRESCLKFVNVRVGLGWNSGLLPCMLGRQALSTMLYPQPLLLFSLVQAGCELMNSPVSTLSLPRMRLTGVHHHPEL